MSGSWLPGTVEELDAWMLAASLYFLGVCSIAAGIGLAVLEVRRRRRARARSSTTLVVASSANIGAGDLVQLGSGLMHVDAVDHARATLMVSPATPAQRSRARARHFWRRIW